MTPCETAWTIQHEITVHYLSNDFQQMHELRKRLSRHRHTCPVCNGLTLHRQLWGEGVMVAEDER